MCLIQEYVVAVPKMGKLQAYEKLLKQFKYKKALFAALKVSQILKVLLLDMSL